MHILEYKFQNSTCVTFFIYIKKVRISLKNVFKSIEFLKSQVFTSTHSLIHLA